MLDYIHTNTHTHTHKHIHTHILTHPSSKKQAPPCIRGPAKTAHSDAGSRCCAGCRRHFCGALQCVLRCVAERVAVSCVVLHVVMLAGCRHQFCGALQCVLWRVAVRAAVCCSACCIKLCHVARNDARRHFLRCVAVRVTVCYNVGCGVLWCVVVCCGVLWCVARSAARS